MLDDAGVVVRKTHSYLEAKPVVGHMRPPCFVIGIVRSLFTRNPSDFFAFLVAATDHGANHTFSIDRELSSYSVQEMVEMLRPFNLRYANELTHYVDALSDVMGVDMARQASLQDFGY